MAISLVFKDFPIDCYRRTGTQLDFISWHVYNDDIKGQISGIEKAKILPKDYPRKSPEILVAERNKSFDPSSFEDLAYESKRASFVVTNIISMLETGVDWTFYYHI